MSRPAYKDTNINKAPKKISSIKPRNNVAQSEMDETSVVKNTKDSKTLKPRPGINKEVKPKAINSKTELDKKAIVKTTTELEKKETVKNEAATKNKVVCSVKVKTNTKSFKKK